MRSYLSKLLPRLPRYLPKSTVPLATARRRNSMSRHSENDIETFKQKFELQTGHKPTKRAIEEHFRANSNVLRGGTRRRQKQRGTRRR